MSLNLSGSVFTAEKDRRLFGLARDKDILPIIDADKADVGFVGTDTYGEQDTALEFSPILPAFGRFVLAAATTELKEPMVVATSYPKALAKFAIDKSLTISGIWRCSGSGELMPTPAWDISNAVFDMRISGRTLTDNRLVVVEEGDEVAVGLVYGKV